MRAHTLSDLAQEDFAIEAMELRSQDGDTEDGLVVRRNPARNTAVSREWMVCLAVSGLRLVSRDRQSSSGQLNVYSKVPSPNDDP